jgi:aspartokinase
MSRDLKLVRPWVISSAVRDEINYDLSIQDALARDYANISAVTRTIKPKLEEKLGTRVNDESVITALKRLRGTYPPASEDIRRVIAESVVNVRTNVSKISVEKTRKTLGVVGALLTSHEHAFLQVSESLTTITMIFDRKLRGAIKEKISETYVLEEGENMAAIIIESPPLITKTPGCLINFYNAMARKHINIEDTVSCHTDTIIVVRMQEVGKAFSALTDLISENRRNLEMGERNDGRNRG